jgi:hypothetical protein
MMVVEKRYNKCDACAGSTTERYLWESQENHGISAEEPGEETRGSGRMSTAKCVGGWSPLGEGVSL